MRVFARIYIKWRMKRKISNRKHHWTGQYEKRRLIAVRDKKSKKKKTLIFYRKTGVTYIFCFSVFAPNVTVCKSLQNYAD